MNKRGRSRAKRRRISVGSPVLTLPAACFGLGLALGCLFASWVDSGADSPLIAYLDSYFSALAQDGIRILSATEAAWEVARWPLFLLLAGATLFRKAAIPALFCARGFLLSYAVSVFVRLLGWTGLALAGAVLGIPTLFSTSALFLLVSWMRIPVKEPKKRALYWGLTAGCLTAGAMLHFWISPVLLRAAAAAWG